MNAFARTLGLTYVFCSRRRSVKYFAMHVNRKAFHVLDIVSRKHLKLVLGQTVHYERRFLYHFPQQAQPRYQTPSTPKKNTQKPPSNHSTKLFLASVPTCLLTLDILHCNKPAQIKTSTHPHEIPNMASGTASFPIDTMKCASKECQLDAPRC